ncbi:MAG: tyrosine-type recombinase/integrase, partial [Gammaproteobacteria bacterium]|nr:tyrosine-type recombinase/integrase [Gammaproteobacteria bacterium]
PDTGQVFLNANGLPITRFGVRYITRKYGAKALPPSSNKVVNPHSLRHTTAMHLLHAGNDINMISFWLGHADINTTHVYVEIDMEMKRKMLADTKAPTVDTTPSWQQPGILQWLQMLNKQPELCGANR